MVNREDVDRETVRDESVAADPAGRAEAGASGVDAGGAAVGAGPDVASAGGNGEAAELELLQQEIGQLRDRHLRLAAEFDNYRKRVERERSESRLRSQAEIVARMLDGLDDLERVISVDPESTTVDALVEGIRLVERKIRQGLDAVGLEAVDAEGRRFDPASMEAVMTAPTEDPEEDEMVADVFQKGYRFNGILVRPAKVRVKKFD